MDANNIPDEKRVLTLLSSIGKDSYETLRNLLAPANPRSSSWKEVVDALKAHFEPKPLIISERFVFNKRQQKSEETVADYVAALRKLSIHCKFGDFLDDALRDRFVCGLRSEGMQKKRQNLPFNGRSRLLKAWSLQQPRRRSCKAIVLQQHKVKVKLCTFCNVSNTTTIVVTGVGSITTLLISVCSDTNSV